MQKSIIIIFLLSLFSFLFFGQSVLAADTTIQCCNGAGGSYPCTGFNPSCSFPATPTTRCECIPNTGSKVFTSPGMPKFSNPLDTLQVPLPSGFMNTKNGITCEKGAKEGEFGNCQVPFIAEYIAGWFKYAVGIGALLGVMTAMIGGFLWIVSAGNAQKIGEAKNWITNGLIGIVLLATSYIILYQINPELTKMKSISVGFVNKEEDKSGDTAAQTQVANVLAGAIEKMSGLTNGTTDKPFVKSDYNNNLISTCAKNVISNLDKAGIPFRISTLKTGHSDYVSGTTKYSDHYSGNGIDIGCRPEEKSNCAKLMEYINTNMKNSNIRQLLNSDSPQYQWVVPGQPYLKQLPDHYNHIHIGVSC